MEVFEVKTTLLRNLTGPVKDNDIHRNDLRTILKIILFIETTPEVYMYMKVYNVHRNT